MVKNRLFSISSTERNETSGDASGERPIIIFYHIYKAGGTSIIVGLRRQFGEPAVLEVDRHPLYGSEKVYNADFFERIVRLHFDVVAYTAHKVVPNIHLSKTLQVFPIVFVRHPLLRARSVHRFERGEAGFAPRHEFARKYDFGNWILWGLDSDPVSQNFQTCLLSLSDDGTFTNRGSVQSRRGDLTLVYERLDAMPVVGLVEMFRPSLDAINRSGQKLFPGLDIVESRANSTKIVDNWETELSNIERSLPRNLLERFYAANADDVALFERYRARLAR
jgi:hypothetical protein